MSISQDSAATIVCREVFDETSPPSNEEVIDYAKRLGIDPDAEAHLLDLAREGLMAALPKGWSPCCQEATGAFYYYQASTGTSTWEHPLNAVHKELVAQARAGNRQMSVDEDSKTTAKDLESHEEATLPKESISSKSLPPQTKIPMKLAPLKRLKGDRTGSKKKDLSSDRIQGFKDIDSEDLNEFHHTPRVMDLTSRDYTNLRFQDPRFYENPKLLDSSKAELNLKEVLKRSESLSPRYEKEWEQLTSKFSSEENIIDIDRLSASSLAKADKSGESLNKENRSRHSVQQKELTLTGGGSIFLKSNRSRDTTPSQEGGRLEDFQILSGEQAMSSSSGDKLKSILREKPYEDEERPTEEERKSVRFDLEKEPDIKFTYSGSDEDWESESEGQNVRISAIAKIKKVASIFSIQSQDSDLPDDSEDKQASKDLFYKPTLPKLNPLERMDKFLKKSKIVGKRFVVENVSENEHLNQITKENFYDTDDDFPPRRFINVKNIDLVSKSETDSSIASRSSLLDEIRKSKEIMLQSMKLSDQKMKVSKQREKDEVYNLMKLKHDLETVKRDREGNSTSSAEESKTLSKFVLYKDHDESIQSLKTEFELKSEENRKEIEDNFQKQKLALEKDLQERLEQLKQEMANREEQEIQKLVSEMDEMRRENLKKVKSELEVCYEKERQEILANLKTELDERKRELLELRNQEMEKLEIEHAKSLDDEKSAKLKEQEITKQHSERLKELKTQLDKEFDDLKNELGLQQRDKINNITEEHEKCLAEILRNFRTDEGLARKLYKQRLEEIRADFSRDLEDEVKKQSDRNSAPQESVDYENLRCEKRLIEDKYNTLKEKYLKLKRELRLAIERRNKRKEGNATASETEKSTSGRTRTDNGKTELSDQKSPLMKTRSNSLTTSKSQENPSQGQNPAEDLDDRKLAAGLPGPASAGAKNIMKFESDDTTTASETISIFLSKKKKNFTRKVASTSKLNNNNDSSENPVENIRKQLEKLEDLGDQLPSNETAYTLRYPFQDKSPVTASSELEFFRHRIHVERDSVRRAREALRQQKSAFQGRQKAWKQRSARATLEQLVKEERELSDMEVSLHRTRSLLGEKVIHLRHLEQSLERVANAKKNENDTTVGKNDELTLSDMSSASSGFSSTDLGTDTFIDKLDHYQESTEIIANLENLNSEIREIWGVLNKRQDNNVPPPPTLLYSDLGWLPYQHLTSQPSNVQAFGTPNIQSNILSQLTTAHPPTTTTAQNIIAQYGPNSGFSTSVGTVERSTSNLMERTRNLRDWLRQARVESSDLVSPGQATL